MEYIGRNHPLVEGLSRYLLETALDEKAQAVAARCGLTVTNQVERPTSILLLRLRYLLSSRQHSELLAEECLVRAFTGSPMSPKWLSEEETQTLLTQVQPTADYSPERKKAQLEAMLEFLPDLHPHLDAIARKQAERLEQSHRRVRSITKEGQVGVNSQLPMDIIGFYLIQPE